VVGEGETYEEAMADVKSAIRFHVDTFGVDVLEVDLPVLEAFVAETEVTRSWPGSPRTPRNGLSSRPWSGLVFGWFVSTNILRCARECRGRGDAAHHAKPRSDQRLYPPGICTQAGIPQNDFLQAHKEE